MTFDDAYILDEIARFIDIVPDVSTSITLGSDFVNQLRIDDFNVVNKLTRIEQALVYIKNCLVIDAELDISDSELVLLVNDAFFVLANNDQASCQLQSRIPRISHGKKGRPERLKTCIEVPEYRFELQLERPTQMRFVLHTLSDIPAGTEFLVYRGVYSLVSSDRQLNRFTQRVPFSENFFVDDRSLQLDICNCITTCPGTYHLVVDASTCGDQSRFVAIEDTLHIANAEFIVRQKNESEIELVIKSIWNIYQGDRITITQTTTPYTHWIEGRKRGCSNFAS